METSCPSEFLAAWGDYEAAWVDPKERAGHLVTRCRPCRGRCTGSRAGARIPRGLRPGGIRVHRSVRTPASAKSSGGATPGREFRGAGIADSWTTARPAGA
jgi:hypothetical protein